MAYYRIYTRTTPRRWCLKTKASTDRKYWGCDSGGLYYHTSREAEEGMSRARYLEEMRNWQVAEYERRVTAEDANRRYFEPSRSHPRKPKRSSVEFYGETTFIYNPRESIRETGMAGYELIGLFTSRMPEDEIMKARRRLYNRPGDF